MNNPSQERSMYRRRTELLSLSLTTYQHRVMIFDATINKHTFPIVFQNFFYLNDYET